MSQFKKSFATQQLIPPWHSKGSRNWAFVMEVPQHCIQDYLDAWLNSKGPDLAPYYWQAVPSIAHSYGVLLVCDHPEFSSVRNGEPGYECLAHREVFWFFPAYRYERTADNLLVGRPTLTWIQPFALDDSSYIMFSSREIWGCEKDMADILLNEGATPDELHIDIALDGCKIFSPKSMSHLIGVMHICMKHSPKPFDWGPVMQNRDLAGMLGHFLGGMMGPTSDRTTHKKLLPNRIEINTLKQFRDAYNMEYAAYRAISASSVVHDNIEHPTFYSGDDATIDFMWSDTCAQRWEKLFGLEKPDTSTAPRGHPQGEKSALEKNIDWDMPRVPGKVAIAASFTSDSQFDVIGTLHTYGLPTGE